MLILGDYLGSQEVGEGGELCPFHEVGKMGVTSHLSSWLESRNAYFFLEGTNRAPRV